jgi:hypothetical protein
MTFLEKIKTNFKLIIFILVVLTAGAVAFVYFPRKGVSTEESKPSNEETKIEVFSLAASISQVDSQNHFIIVKHPVDNKEIKVFLNGNPEIVKLEFPFDPKNPPKSGIFTPTLKKITLNDLKPGDQALIESRDNIYQKAEFNAVKRIQVLP